MDSPYDARNLNYLSDALWAEESDIWLLISTADVNITYADVMAMTKVERMMATLAVKAIVKRREQAKKKK